MVYINEWLPNPTGSDTRGEWVELYNNGATGASLSGWILKTSGASKAKLSGTIGAGEYLVLKRSTTKLVLKNTDEKLFLYDAGGKLMDQSAFVGAATEGKSLSRISANELTSYRANELYLWADPTPGAANKVSFDASIIRNTYPVGVSLNKNLGIAEFSGLILSSALAITAFVVFALKKHETLSKLFFARDEEIW